jgi:hypothetical protein
MATKLTRITQLAFGTSGPVGDFGAFGSKALNPASPVFTQNPATIQSLAPFLDGWGQAIIGNYEPPLEDMNGLFLLIFYQLGYILEMGIAEYDAATVYFTNSICQSGGSTYQSLSDNNVGNAPSTNPASWLCVSSTFGANVASASSMILGNDGGSFKISGTTTINNITIKASGSVVKLIFTGILIVNTGGNILLNEGPFTSFANATLELISDGSNWFEISRSPSSAGIPVFNTIAANTPTQVLVDTLVVAYFTVTTYPNVGNGTVLFGPTSSPANIGGYTSLVCPQFTGEVQGFATAVIPRGWWFSLVPAGSAVYVQGSTYTQTM